MESRFRHLLLNIIISTLFFLPTFSCGIEIEEVKELYPIIQPEIKRTKFDESNIKTADFEIISNIGIISIEDFGSNPALELNINYHISDDFFVGVGWFQATGDETSFEVVLGGAPLLSNNEREMTTYLISLGYNALPGEAFVTDNLTYNTSLYITAGLGNTSFAGSDHFTLSVGAGYRVLVSNYFAVYTDFRDNIFNVDIFKEKSTHNLKFTVGVGYYF
ncbi:MAG: outer membrane beta-barrel domain-containing protein [Gammaproteobacteria bacterium]|nr:outer membrane beta-barrel domain-containing protein [Gammaproteobacteria bacterium]